MNDNHDDDVRQSPKADRASSILEWTRRSFLKYVGGAVAAGAVPEALSGCAQQTEATGTTADALIGPIPMTLSGSWVVARASDGFDMQMDVANLQVVGGNLVPISSTSWSYVILRSHPQHVAEAATSIEGDLGVSTPFYDVTSQSAGPSRLVFCVAPGFAGVAFKTNAILSWLSTLPLNVAWNALSDASYAISAYGDEPIAFTKAQAAAGSIPDPTVTQLELTCRLQLSPNELSRFVHSNPPATLPSSQRVEVANSRLAIVDSTGTANERLLANRTLRALYARDTLNPTLHPFLISAPWYNDSIDCDPLPSGARTGIVAQSAAGEGPGIPVDNLILTPYGSSFHANGSWSGAAASAGILTWKHRTSNGRDDFVEASFLCYVLPFGLRAIVTVTTTRQLDYVRNGYASLVSNWVIQLLDTSMTYGAGAGLPPIGYRAMPFQQITVHQANLSIDAPPASAVEAVAPPANPSVPTPPPAAVVGLGPFQAMSNGIAAMLPITALDRRGRQVKFNAPMFVVGAPNAAAAQAQFNNLSTYPAPSIGATTSTNPNILALNRQRVAIAPSTKDHTTVEVDWMLLQVALVPGATPPFIPVSLGLSGVAEATRALAGNDAPMLMYYDESYALPLASITSNNFNTTMMAGETVSSDGSVQPSAGQTLLNFAGTVGAQFSGAGGTGGLVAPSATFQAIGMVHGLANSATDIAGLASATPSINWSNLLGGAKLFGTIGLDDLLNAAKVTKPPAFMAEAYTLVERYAAELELLVDATKGILPTPALEGASTTVAAAVTSGQAALARIEQALGNLPAITPASVASIGSDVTTIINLATPNGPLDSALAAIGSPNSGLARAARNQLAKVFSATQIAGGWPAINAALGAMQQGLDVVRDQKAKIELHVTLPKGLALPSGVGLLTTGGAADPSNLSLSVEINGKASDASQALTTFCSLDNFVLNFPPTAVAPKPWLTLCFDRIFISQQPGQKTNVDVNFDGIGFAGCLNFVNVLRSLIPLDGFSDPPDVSVTANGITAGFSTGLPNICAGVLSLENMKLSAELNVPFIGEITFDFGFCDSDHPFSLTIAFLGGGGYFDFSMAATGASGAALQNLEGSVSICAQIAINLVVASGSLSASAGLTVFYDASSGAVSITAFVDLRGALDILGLISMSIEAYLGLTYTTPNSLSGTCTVTVDVEVAMVSKGVSMTFQHTFYGGPAPSNLPTAAVLHDETATPDTATPTPMLSPSFAQAFPESAYTAYASYFV